MPRLLVPCAFACLVLVSLCKAEEDQPELGKLNQGVVKFARAQVGKKVGDGECTALAIAALKKAGAKTTYDFGVSGIDKDYQWGKPVSAGDALPGDVIQFRDVVTVTKTVRKTATGTSTRTMTRNYPHHTAVIAKNLGKGKFEVYEQNAGGAETSEAERKKVRENPLDLSGKTAGTVWIYRPVKK